jgi:hypothetical protein
LAGSLQNEATMALAAMSLDGLALSRRRKLLWAISHLRHFSKCCKVKVNEDYSIKTFKGSK